MAASATFALKAGVWFRRCRRCMVSPDSQATACPLSGRNSTYRPVQISGAGSLHFPGVPLEVPFGEVARQVRLADRMVRAEDGALHEAETALGSVDVRETCHAHVFVRAMVDGRMASELLADARIGQQFVRH